MQLQRQAPVPRHRARAAHVHQAILLAGQQQHGTGRWLRTNPIARRGQQLAQRIACAHRAQLAHGHPAGQHRSEFIGAVARHAQDGLLPGLRRGAAQDQAQQAAIVARAQAVVDGTAGPETGVDQHTAGYLLRGLAGPLRGDHGPQRHGQQIHGARHAAPRQFGPARGHHGRDVGGAALSMPLAIARQIQDQHARLRQGLLEGRDETAPVRGLTAQAAQQDPGRARQLRHTTPPGPVRAGWRGPALRAATAHGWQPHAPGSPSARDAGAAPAAGDARSAG